MAELELTSAALRVGKLLLAEINYLDEVRGEVEILQSNLNMLAAFVVEAAASWRQDTLLQTALRESLDLAYDCEDVIETYIWQVARHGYDQYEGCQLGSALRRICPLRKAFHGHKIHSQINDLNKRIATLKSNLQRYGVSARVNTISNDQHLTPAPLRRFYTHEREEFVPIGLESQLEELVSRLIDPTDQTVITISEMGGVGKSTLARELYRHPTLREGGYFQAFGWAAASQQLQPDRVLRTLMYSLVPKEDIERRRQIDEDVKADRAHAALYHKSSV